MTKKLLLADDSITIQKVIGIIFETEDYQLLVTDNGDAAFTKALEELPDLVIADISMPGKDGFELCQAVKSDPRLAATSVMLLPGTFDHFDEQRAQAVGADGWLTKPFESQALLTKVAQLLETGPVRLAEESSAPVFAALEESEEPAADMELPVIDEHVLTAAAAPVVDEALLGLDEIAEQDMTVLPEESADDIWDAISFEEDDLSLADAAEEAPSLAAVADETPVVGAEVAEEIADDFGRESAYQPETEEPADQAAGFGFAEEDSFDAADEAVNDVPAFAAEKYEEAGDLELESASASESYVLRDESAESFELQDEAMEAPSIAAATGVGFEELEPLQLAEETADVEELDIEEQIWTESTTAAKSAFAGNEIYPEDDSLLVAEADEEILELADEDILELADEEVFDEQPLREAFPAGDAGLSEGDTASDFAPEAFEADTIVAYEPEPLADAGFAIDESALLEEESTAADGSDLIELVDSAAAETDMLDLADRGAESESSGMDAAGLFVEGAAEPVAAYEEETAIAEDPVESRDDQFFGGTGEAESSAAQDVEEDEGFYFDAAETEESPGAETVVESTAGVAREPLATAAGTANLNSEPGLAQVEQQLRQLSEEDLKELVAKVAGPIIEKLASEMLQQIAWEVVPDLAETMIRAEIRKIKNAEV